MQTLKSNCSKKLFEVKKSAKELCLMLQKIDAKFEGKMTCAFKIDMMNSANFA